MGCARNEVDSSELAGRLELGGYELVEDAPDVVLVNTCAFVASAKKDSIDTLLAAADGDRKVVAVGCLAERYGAELADSMPEAAAVLGFDSYGEIGARLDDVLAGRPLVPHRPRDRRTLLPITPVERQGHAVSVPGHASAAEVPGWTPPVLRRRLGDSPVAPLKLASGCDRRCTFCAIPSFRGAFVSRLPDDLLAEAAWLAGQGVREIFLVSENSTSYGKDLGDLRSLEALLPELAAVDGIERVRVSYLQPAEMRPGLIGAIAGTAKVASYFDLSFQHASPGILRRMRRFGDPDSFLKLLDAVRREDPCAGVRSNVIAGFPGETEADFEMLCEFLESARLDVTGVFGYSDEDGTEAASYDGKLDDDEIAARVSTLSALVDELTTQRAEGRIGERVTVMVESVTDGVEGRAEHQGPEVDGTTTLPRFHARIGDLVEAIVVDTAGADLVAEAVR